MSDFDFIESWYENTLQTEAVAKVIGRVIGALIQGMTEAGLSDDNAHKVIDNAFATIFDNMTKRYPPES